MKRFLLAALVFSGLSLSLGAQADTIFTLVAEFTGTTQLTDSTFNATANHPGDQLGQGWLPGDIEVGYRIFDGFGRMYEITVINSTTFETSNLEVKELQDWNQGPSGTGVIYRKATGSDRVPVPLQGFGGLAPAVVSRIHIHNAINSGEDLSGYPSRTELGDTATAIRASSLRLYNNIADLEGETNLSAGDRAFLKNGAIYSIKADSVSGLPVDGNTVLSLANGVFAHYESDKYINVDHLGKTRDEDIQDAFNYIEVTGRCNRSVYIEGGSFDPANITLPSGGNNEYRILLHKQVTIDTTLVLPGHYSIEGVGVYVNDVQFAHFTTGAVLKGNADNAAVLSTSESGSNEIKNLSIDAFNGTNRIGLSIYNSPSVVLNEVAVNHVYIGIQVTNSYWIYADKVTTRATTGNGTYGIHFIDDRAVSTNVCHLQWWSNITMKGPCIHMEPRSDYNMNSINFDGISTEVKNTPVVTFDVTTAGRIFNCTFKNIHTADDAAPYPIFKVDGPNKNREVSRIYINNVKNSDPTSLIEGNIWNAVIENANQGALQLSTSVELNQGIIARDRANDFDFHPTYQIPGQRVFVANDTTDLTFLSRDATLGTVEGPDGVPESAFSVTNVGTSSQVRAYVATEVLPDQHHLILGGWFKNCENEFPFKVRSLVAGFVTETGDSVAVDEKENIGYGPITGSTWSFVATSMKIVNPSSTSGQWWVEVSNSSTGDTTYGEYANLFGLIIPDSIYTSADLGMIRRAISPQYDGTTPGNVATGYNLETTQSLIVGDSLKVSGDVLFSGLPEISGTREVVTDGSGNIGYQDLPVTRSGCITIDSVNSVWVTHNLGSEPEKIEVFPRDDVGSYFIDSITTTQFKLNWQHINPGVDICWSTDDKQSEAKVDYDAILTEYGGSSVTALRQRLDIEHINRLKILGIWDKLDGYYVFETENDTLAKINWISPGSNTATVSGSASWSTAGYSTTSGGWVNTGFPGNQDQTNFKQGSNALLDVNIGWYATGYTNSVGATRVDIAGFDAAMTAQKRNLQNQFRYYVFTTASFDDSVIPTTLNGLTQIKRLGASWTMYAGSSANVDTRSTSSYEEVTGTFKLGDADTGSDESAGALFKIAYLGGGMSTTDMQALETEIDRYRAALSASYPSILIHKHDADNVQHVGYGQSNREASDIGKTAGNLAQYATDGTLLDYTPTNPFGGQNGLEAIIDSIYQIVVDPSYGGAFVTESDPDTLSITAATPVISGGTTAGGLKLFTSSSGRLTYTGTTTKSFSAIYSASFTTSTNNVVADFEIYLNGSPIAKSKRFRKIGTGTDIGSASTNALFELSNGDYLEIFWDADVSTTLYIKSSNFTVHAISPQ